MLVHLPTAADGDYYLQCIVYGDDWGNGRGSTGSVHVARELESPV